jgi:exo-beta-1,3-glucanase (GH17 family)
MATAILLGALTSNMYAEDPVIVIDYIPQLGTGGVAEGQVKWSGLTAASAGEYAVIAMLRSTWGEDYVKPLYESYLTAVDAGGYFYTDITTGGAGDYAIEDVSFFFVRRSTFAGVAGGSVQYGSMAGKYLGQPLTVSKTEFWQYRLPPVPSIPSGFVDAGQTVTLSAEAGTSIRYTTDGSDPATSPTAQNYTSATSLKTPSSGSLLVKAVAVRDGKYGDVASLLWLPKETMQWGNASNFNRPLFGLCVSLALNGEQYGITLSEEETRRRLAPIQHITHWIRSYGAINNGHEHINKIAKQELGLKTMIGIYVNNNPAHVNAQIEGLKAILEKGPAPDLISVGNELFLDPTVTTDIFTSAIDRVRELLLSKSLAIPVGSVDIAGAVWRHAVKSRLDYIGIDIYAGTWDNTPTSQMTAVTKKMYADEVAKYAPKLVLVTEIGTPYAGGSYVPPGASATQTPSEAKARTYLSDMIDWMHADNAPLFWFSAYDEPTKSAGGHKIEQYFGLMDGNLQLHPFYMPPLSNAVIDEVPYRSSLRAQPNPVRDSFSINAPEGSRVKVFDMAGKLVLEQIYSPANIDVANLPAGAYLVRVGNASCKIIKTK